MCDRGREEEEEEGERVVVDRKKGSNFKLLHARRVVRVN